MNNINELAVRIFNASDKPNLFFSPYSISSLLCMVLEGANKEIKNEVLKSIELSNVSLPVKGAIWSVANSIWHDSNCQVNEAYVEILKNNYHSEVFGRDFNDSKTVDEINQWVSDKTHNKITEIIDCLSPDEKMALINAVYFKGKWMDQFDKNNTRKQIFHCLGGNKSEVDMMYRKGDYKFFFDQINQLQLIELPYKGESVSMVIVMPFFEEPLGEGKAKITGLANVVINEMGKGGTNVAIGETITVNIDSPSLVKALKNLEKQKFIKIEDMNYKDGIKKEDSPTNNFFTSITENKVSNWFKELNNRRISEVTLKLPKFKIEDDWELTNLLSKIGFSNLMSSELTGMGSGMSVSRILHKSFVEVDEEGTEAAAVTAGTLRCMSMARKFEFVVDRPFVFFLKHNETQTILFMGKVVGL